MNFFNLENRFFSGLRKIVDCVYLSLLWFLFSIPIITIGASTTALYHTTNKNLIHSRGYVWQEFWDSFKSNFRQSTIMWIIFLIFYGLSIFNFIAFRQISPSDGIGMDIVIFIIMIALITNLAIYYFPCIARFENTIWGTLKNSLMIAYANLPQTFLLLLLLAVSIALMVFLFPLVAFIPALYMLFANQIIEKIFRKYASPEEYALEDELNKLDEDL